MPLRFEVTFETGARWQFDVAFDGERSALARPAMVADGLSDGVVRPGGYREQVPYAEAQLAVEEELRRLWDGFTQNAYGRSEGGPFRVALVTVGFDEPPPERKSMGGKRRVSAARWAVRARRALKNRHRAAEEKQLTRARKAGVLHEPPRAHEFTELGQALLDVVDLAKDALVALLEDEPRLGVEVYGPALVPPRGAARSGFSIDVVNAAIEDLAVEGRLEVTKSATAADRAWHRFDAIEIVARL